MVHALAVVGIVLLGLLAVACIAVYVVWRLGESPLGHVDTDRL